MTKKRLVRAVQEKDLDEFLRNAGLLNNADKGILQCSQCHRKLTKDEISRFVIDNQEVSVFCSRSECLDLGER